MRKSYKVKFAGGNGHTLAGIVDVDEDNVEFFAIFNHCFTCTKDLKAIVRISQNLARQGIGVLRFDFTGLGESGGNFSDQNFHSNIQDTLAAFSFLKSEYQAPKLLIGHSLGGAAALASSSQLPDIQAISTLASPSDTFHLAQLLSKMNPEIIETGQGKVVIGGREYLVRKELIDDLNDYDLKSDVQNFTGPHLIFHSPTDQTLGMRYARQMMEYAGNQASLVSLQNADHLLTSDPRDVGYVADILATWAKRHVDLAQ